MPPVLRAVEPAPFTSVQDTGRRGWQRFGVACAGAMDPEAMAVANVLAGNPAEAAAVEFPYGGGTWELLGGSCRVAVGGGSFTALVDGVPAPPCTSVTLRAGQVLRVRGSRGAVVWGYLAVSGGFALAQEMGSVSTHVRSGMGGLAGRWIAAGDALPLARPVAPAGPERTILLPAEPANGAMRVVLGPQDDHFTAEAIDTLLGSEYRVDYQSDRTGYRLVGPALAHRGGYNIVSDGLAAGSIQVPGNGQPIVLLMDAQPIGGYPKIATIVSADRGRMAQRLPSRGVRFQAVSLDDAQLLRREFVFRLKALHLRVVDRAG